MKCDHCNAVLKPEDLARPGCPYCGAVLSHHARAAEKTALVQQLLQDADGNGIPDIFERGARPAPGARVVNASASSSVVIVSTEVTVDGRQVDPEELPPAAQQVLKSLGGPSASPAAPGQSPRTVILIVAIALALVIGAAGFLLLARS